MTPSKTFLMAWAAAQVSVVLTAASVQAGTGWNSLQAGNPVIPGYFADPCSRKFGDTYYLYVTPDGWDVGRGPAGVWSSKDYVHWTWQPMNWPKTEFKWAPSVVKFKDNYYMYNSVPCQIWAAVSDTPVGPWTNLMGENGKEMIPDQTPKGTIVLDGEAFIDDDESVYLWYSTWWRPTVAKLKPDMRTFDGDPIQYFKHADLQDPPKGLVQRCMEGPYMFKRKGTYYLMYSDDMCQDSTYNVKYSTSKSPTGPFEYDPAKNPILETTDDDTVDGPGHHSMLVEGDRVYIVYHRHDNPHDPDGAHRQTCISELYFNQDGSIEKVQPGHLGVGYLAPSTKRDFNLALGKTATASSCLSPDFKPEYAVDANNGTLWKAAGQNYPQWLQVDLGKASPVRRIETEFQYPQVANRYLIEHSTDGKTWKTFADRKDNKTPGIMIDQGDVQARYVRITLMGQDSGRPDQWAALWGFNVYDGIDKPNQAPVVDLGPEQNLNFRFPAFTIEGAVHDDGLPNGPVKVQWSKVSGPGNVAFAHSDRCRTGVTVDQAGQYVLKLTADDGQLKGEGKLTVNMAPPTDRVIAYDFDDDSGAVVKDSSDNGKYGVMHKGATHSFGIRGQAANLDSNTGYIAITPIGELKSATVAAWINLHTVRTEPSSLLCSDGSATGALKLVINSSGAVQWGVEGQPAQASEYRFSPEHAGEWHHVAVSCDPKAKAVSFYIDGKLDVTRTLTEAPPLNLSTQVRLGGANDGARCLDGELDEFRVFERALSTGEIAALATKPASTTIADVKKLKDGIAVVLMSKPVALAAANPLSFERATDFFYVAEPDGTEGIRVEDGKTGQDKTRADVCVSLAGVVKTKGSGERYVELTAAPTLGAPRAAMVIPTKMADVAKAVARPVSFQGVVKDIAGDGKSFTIAEGGGGGTEVRVSVEHLAPTRKLAAGNTVVVSGVVSVEGESASAARPVVCLRELTRLSPPPAPGLAFYSFEEDGDIAKDSSSNNQDARLVNSPQHVDGKQGKALRFDGEKSYLELPDLGLQPALTVAAWINLAAIGKDGIASILHSDGWNWGDLHFLVSQENKQVGVFINGVADLRSKFEFTDDKLGKWVQVALTYDAKARSLQLYVNGRLETSTGFGTPRPVNLSRVKVGCWEGHARMWNGMMDEVRFYDRALSAVEIADLCARAKMLR